MFCGGVPGFWMVNGAKFMPRKPGPCEPAPPMVGTTGDIEALSLWAGQSVALATKQQSAADIVADLVAGL